jgi:hypothetical protein
LWQKAKRFFLLDGLSLVLITKFTKIFKVSPSPPYTRHHGIL